MDELPIVAAGREVPEALDRIRRYCGLRWSGGLPETWAWHYYDMVPTALDDVVTPVDVLCAAALHPGLSREDLDWFRRHQADVAEWLHRVPTDRELATVPDDVADHIASLPEQLPGVAVTLLSKVLHRKRPRAIPLLDKHVIDRFRPVTGKRAAVEAWAPLVRQMRADGLEEDQWFVAAVALSPINTLIAPDAHREAGPWLTRIRAVDIAIWMGSR